MRLVEEQDLFLGHVAALLGHARALGFVITAGELFRTPEQQRLHIRAGRSQTMASQHLRRLAVDLNFFRRTPDGALELCLDRAALAPLGAFWEGLDEANRWGGNWPSFKDAPHFERRDGVGAAQRERAAAQAIASAEDRRAARMIGAAVGRRQPNRRADVLTVQALLNAMAARGAFPLEAPLAEDGVFGESTAAATLACQGVALKLKEPDGVVSPGGPTIRALAREAPTHFCEALLGLLMLAASREAVARFAGPIQAAFERFGIDTPLRQAHFLAQVGHESGELRFREEIASGAAYEGRADLGNLRPGDGTRFKGRGLIQLTGRSNYERFGEAVGRREALLENPGLVASDLALCVAAAGWFWQANGLNALADRDDLTAVTRRVNGGLNGVEDRRRLLERARTLYGLV
jgi:predicted chitinase